MSESNVIEGAFRAGSAQQKQPETQWKLLGFGDSPRKETGFGRVTANLFKRFRPHFPGGVDFWGINDDGWPLPKIDYIDNLFPARMVGRGNGSWNHPEALTAFIRQLMHGGYTHVWMLQDTFQLINNKFPTALQEACNSPYMKDEFGRTIAKAPVKSLYYFPVDAPLEPNWCDIIKAVDVPVAYTEYGKAAVLRAIPSQPLSIEVIPHGVDTAVYHPLEPRNEVRKAILQILVPKGFCSDKDCLIVNVNSNQRRKDPLRSLEILRALLDRGANAKLIMHMARWEDPGCHDGDLELFGAQLGLRYGVEWCHTNHVFHANQRRLKEEHLNWLYNAADLYLTTTLGEGWGLPVCESLAAGCPVAIPHHTACLEISRRLSGLGMADALVDLPVCSEGVSHMLDNSRVRYRVEVQKAADTLIAAQTQRVQLTESAKDWLSWDRIAGEWLKLMEVE